MRIVPYCKGLCTSYTFLKKYDARAEDPKYTRYDDPNIRYCRTCEVEFYFYPKTRCPCCTHVLARLKPVAGCWGVVGD